MSDEEWATGWHRALGVRLDGDALEVVDERGRRVVDDDLLLLLNAHEEPVHFSLPSFVPEVRWSVIFDTDRPTLKAGDEMVTAPQPVTLAARSLMLLSHAR